MKEAVFDIETSDLAAVGAGVLLCCVIKPVGGKPSVLRYDDLHCKPGHEARLVKEVIKALAPYDLLIGHNIDRFDLCYLKSKCAVFGLPFDLHALTYDTLKAFKRIGLRTRQNNFGKPSASLAFVVDFFGFPQRKTGIYPREHWQTVWGEGNDRREAMNHLVEHCLADVDMNTEIYHRLFALDTKCVIRRMP